MNNNASSLSPELFRVIDANLNRLREGIRVVEDIMRYKANNKTLASQLKTLRHKAQTPDTKLLLAHRDSINDVLKSSTKSEQKRHNLESIIIANFKRAEESARVLEELYKLTSVESSELFKTIRYELYNLEKEILLNESI
jgi:thiamine-phosphate pyrophosphorylase